MAALRDCQDMLGIHLDELSYSGVFAADNEQQFFGFFGFDSFEGAFPGSIECNYSVAVFQGNLHILVSGAVDRDIKVFAGAGSRFCHGWQNKGCAAAGEKDVFPAQDFSGTHNGADIMRVFDVIKENQAAGADHIRKRGVGKIIAVGANALVFACSQLLGEFGPGNPGDWNAAALRGTDQFAHPWIVFGTLGTEDGVDFTASGENGFRDGIDAIEESGHNAIIVFMGEKTKSCGGV